MSQGEDTVTPPPFSFFLSVSQLLPSSSLTQNITDRHCVNVSSTWCDFTEQQISVYGYYTARVKALLGDQSSEWAASQRFTPDIDSEARPVQISLLRQAEPFPHASAPSCFSSSCLLSLRQPSSALPTSRSCRSGRPLKL